MVTDTGPEVRDSRSQHGLHEDRCFHQTFRKLWEEASAARLGCEPPALENLLEQEEVRSQVSDSVTVTRAQKKLI